MSNKTNDQLYDQINELLPDLPQHEKARLHELSEANDLEALFQWQRDNYGKIVGQGICKHPSRYEKETDMMHCTQCDIYISNKAYED